MERVKLGIEEIEKLRYALDEPLCLNDDCYNVDYVELTFTKHEVKVETVLAKTKIPKIDRS